jgi:gamma-glutamyl-gamma-aminobutyrate hydrolase PuuD
LKIALSQRIIYHKGRAYDSIEHGWYNYLDGHTLYFLPNYTDQDFERIANSIDLFIITGGDDIPLRRIPELRLAGIMMRSGKPVLGVCHGCFLLTHTLGGIVQNKEGHYDIDHVVNYQGSEYTVNSYHTNYIYRLHDSAIPLATDQDGDVEAWIDGTIAGVVWHPERMKQPFLPAEIAQLIKI